MLRKKTYICSVRSEYGRMCKEAYFTPTCNTKSGKFRQSSKLEETDRSLDLYTHLFAVYPQHLYTSHGAMYFYLSFCFEAIPDACITMIGRKTGSMPYLRSRELYAEIHTRNRQNFKIKYYAAIQNHSEANEK